MSNLEQIDPGNILAIVSHRVREAVLKAYATHPELVDLCETELEEEIHPSKNTNNLRLSFWDEYTRARDDGDDMEMTKIYEGIMTRDGFYKFLNNTKKVIWMMCRPTEEFIHMRETNYRLRQEYDRILRVPLIDSSGNIKIKEARLSLDIYKMYADRMHGSIVQRVEKKIQNIPANDISGDPDELRKKIQELEAIQVDVKKTTDES